MKLHSDGQPELNTGCTAYNTGQKSVIGAEETVRILICIEDYWRIADNDMLSYNSRAHNKQTSSTANITHIPLIL